MFSSRTPVRRLVALVALALATALAPLDAQGRTAPMPRPSAQDLQRGHRMLEQLHEDLRTHYYDSTFAGVDMKERLRIAHARIDSAATRQHMFGVIAQFLFDLNDSHTTFIPPGIAADVEYGWRWQIIGDSTYVTAVKPGSDAEQKGLRVGDRIVTMDGAPLVRQNFRLLRYVYYTLSPRPGMRLVVESPEGERRTIDVIAKITPRQRVVDLNDADTWVRFEEEWVRGQDALRFRWRAIGDSILLWKMPQFVYDQRDAIDAMMRRARNYRSLVLDLRDNPGGAVVTQLHLISHFFDRDVTVATVRERSGEKPTVAKKFDREPYRGRLIILIDSRSASSSEMVARITQLEGRAIIVGDRSMGAVMTSRQWGHEVGFGKVYVYGASITVSDVIMPDGERLERRGVVPDDIVLPTAADLAAQRDPALAKAIELAGGRVTPEEAGRMLRTAEF